MREEERLACELLCVKLFKYAGCVMGVSSRCAHTRQEMFTFPTPLTGDRIQNNLGGRRIFSSLNPTYFRSFEDLSREQLPQICSSSSEEENE